MITKERERTLKTIHAGRPLKTINYLNILAFVLTYVANMELYGDFDLWSPRQVQRYFCLLTPLKMTPMIMDIVVVFQGAFVIVQMMPRARNSFVVQDGIGCWYISAALCQVCLILGFNSFFNAIFTTFCMGALLYCSLRIVKGVSNSSRNEEHIDALELFWLFQFPFLLQVGWYIFVLIWGINVLLTFTVDNIWFDFFAFLAACGCITWIGIKMPFFREGSTDYTISSGLSWAMLGVTLNLNSQHDYIGSGMLLLLQCVAGGISVGLFFAVLISACKQRRNTPWILSENDSDGTVSEYESETSYEGSDMEEAVPVSTKASF